jgi:3,5-epimerase/4-reductase
MRLPADRRDPRVTGQQEVVMPTLVFGSRGYAGAAFAEHFTGGGSTADIADPAQVAAELDRHRPEVVINCAGKTGRPNVDWCEQHKLETLRSNVTGPLVLLEQCLARGVFLVHLSTGCFYTGDNQGRGFGENDPPNFQGSYYVRTKLCAEQAMAEFPVLILRPRMMFDGSLSKRNLLNKLASYERVLDEPNSFTYLPDLLSAAEELVRRRATGVFHIVNPGRRSPFEVMEQFRRIVAPRHVFARLATCDLPLVASAGRSNCVLSTAKLERLGIRMRDVGDALDLAVNSIRHNQSLDVTLSTADTGGSSRADPWRAPAISAPTRRA